MSVTRPTMARLSPCIGHGFEWGRRSVGFCCANCSHFRAFESGLLT